MTALLEGLKALGIARLAAMGGVAAAVLGLLAFLALRGSSGPMALLYADLDLRDAGQIADQLDHAHIPHRDLSGGTRIMVPAGDVARARLLLATQGLPTGGSIGYEIFDHGNGLMSTPFQDRINETRALEGELARTIQQISGIRAARVHIVLPTRAPFARHAQEAKASVLLTMAGAAELDREGTQAVLNLVAAAIPGLRPQNIAIIDNRGDVLSRAGQPTGADATAATAEEVKRATELRLARAVEHMLGRTLGSGHVRAEASVTMDFQHVRETQQTYDPNGQVARSEQSSSDKQQSTTAPKTVSVKNNLPNANAGAPPAAGRLDQRRQTTTNYEISNTVRTIVQDAPQISRISLAVLVDGTEVAGPGGKQVWRPRSPAELAQIAALVKSAIGYDNKRGDHVEVATMRFTSEGRGAPAPARPHLFGLPIGHADLMRLIESLLFGVIAVLALVLVLRPMMLRLSTIAAAAPALAASGSAGGALRAIAGPQSALPQPALAALAAPQHGAEDERLIEIANVEGQLRASSIRRIADMVEKHPDESISIVRSWMLQEGG